MLWKPDPANWLTWRRTLDSWGYSPLNEINRNNVSRLKMTWTRGIGTGRTQEATPLVYNGTHATSRTRATIIMAMDARTGDLKWEYRRKYPEGVNGGTNRNMAIWGTTLIDAGADNSVYAVDATDWRPGLGTQVIKVGLRGQRQLGADHRQRQGHHRPSVPARRDPRVVHHHRARRADRQGAVAHTHDSPTRRAGQMKRGAMCRWNSGGTSAPGWCRATTRETNLIFVGTSVTIPAPKFTLGGNDKQHLYHNSTLAIDADTGKIVWYYQHVVDHWDLDHPFERLLVETAVAPDPKEVAWINPKIKPGERRRVITGIPGKTGIVYTLDRRTGEFLWATADGDAERRADDRRRHRARSPSIRKRYSRRRTRRS